MRRILGPVAGAVLLCAAPVAAQEHRAWPERAYVTLDLPFQVLNNDFVESLTFADSVRKTENVTFVNDYASTRGALFDVGIGVRVRRNLGVGITVSRLQHSSSASFDLAVPNPIAANNPLGLTGSVSGLNRNEIGVHVQALYAIALGKTSRLMVSAGPSVFDAKQDVVRSVEFDTLPGFTALKFDRSFVTEVRRTVTGFNIGADITWALRSHLGIGTVTRYSRGTFTLDPGSQSGFPRSIAVHAGGLQIGGGIRLLF